MLHLGHSLELDKWRVNVFRTRHKKKPEGIELNLGFLVCGLHAPSRVACGTYSLTRPCPPSVPPPCLYSTLEWTLRSSSPSLTALARAHLGRYTRALTTIPKRWWPSRSSTWKRLRMRSRTSSRRLLCSASVTAPTSPAILAPT